MALLLQDKVLVKEMKLRDQLIGRGFGELKNQVLVLDLHEALFLSAKDKLEIENESGKKADAEELMKLGQKADKKFYSNHIVFADLRERGFVVKTGLKFGFDFRVYPRGKKQGEAHTQWVVSVCTQEEKFSMPELSRMVRLAGNIKTELLQAIVDSEDDINYYRIERIVP